MHDRTARELGFRFRPKHPGESAGHMGNAQKHIVKNTTQAFTA